MFLDSNDVLNSILDCPAACRDVLAGRSCRVWLGDFPLKIDSKPGMRITASCPSRTWWTTADNSIIEWTPEIHASLLRTLANARNLTNK